MTITDDRLRELDKRTERFSHNAAYSSSMREAPVEVTQSELRELVQAMLALRQSSPPDGQPADGWQDISTAPKDGTHVLVCFDGTMTPPTVAHWFGPPPLPGLRAGDWYLSVQQLEGPSINPTHWRPLPATPSNPGTSKVENSRST